MKERKIVCKSHCLLNSVLLAQKGTVPEMWAFLHRNTLTGIFIFKGKNATHNFCVMDNTVNQPESRNQEQLGPPLHTLKAALCCWWIQTNVGELVVRACLISLAGQQERRYQAYIAVIQYSRQSTHTLEICYILKLLSRGRIKTTRNNYLPTSGS